MKRKIILAPGLRGNELIKNLAIRGISFINVEIMNAAELARMSLVYAGVGIEESFIDVKEGYAVMAKAVEGEDYFGKVTYEDVKKIATAINDLRNITPAVNESEYIENALVNGIFEEKNRALISVLKKYIDLLKDNKKIDKISLVKKAIREGSEIAAEFTIVREIDLTPIEKELLEKVSSGNYTVISLNELVNSDNNNEININSIKNCYGATNEVETILDNIYSSKALDSCTVAVTDPASYAQIFLDYSLAQNIPITFGCGISIMNTNPAKLLYMYNSWMTTELFGKAALMSMFNSPSFDRRAFVEKIKKEVPDAARDDYSWSSLWDNVSNLRLTNDRTVNQARVREFEQAIDRELQYITKDLEKSYAAVVKVKRLIPAIKIIADELSLPTDVFIEKYSLLRKGDKNHGAQLLMQFDKAALMQIVDELRVVSAAGIKQSLDDVIRSVLKLSIGGMSSEAGSIFVTDIQGALSCPRKNLYIVGMAASKFPGSPKENFLLLDSDLELFSKQADYLTSDGKVLKKLALVNSLMALASGLKCNINLSYAGMNIDELKVDNISSAVFELLRKAQGSNFSFKDLESKVTTVSYFDPAISNTREIGKAYTAINNTVVHAKRPVNQVPKTQRKLDVAYSPTAINQFFKCPKSFMLKYIMHLSTRESEKAFEIISAAHKGTIIHTMAEMLANSQMTAEEFLEAGEALFDCYISKNPPLITDRIADIKQEYLEILSNTYDSDPHREIPLSEEDIQCTHECGVMLCGFPDRVEKLENGKYLIVDYKTGRTIEHKQDDIDTCLQVVMYAYLLEKQGYDIAGCEFRYLALGETITCKYDEDIKKKLNDKLTIFKNALVNNTFMSLINDKKSDACKFCDYANICKQGN